MALEKYRQKRHFKETPEPQARVVRSAKAKRFVVQKHAATHLHYDFRLEMNGVLKSWAVPKIPPARAGIKRLAVQVEDHPVAYAKFHGVIPEGEYGGGRVKIWDKGTYQIVEKTPVSYKFELFGRKLTGVYVLYKFKDKNWLLFKTKH
jgi:DNA ligase D-like protein (predicted 3'-phosphoesterase)